MAAASVAAALLVGTVSVPYASADDDLKDKQRKVEKSIDHAHDELDHSSKRLVAATERLEAARSQLAHRAQRAGDGPRQAGGRAGA